MSHKPDPLLKVLSEKIAEVAKKFEADEGSSLLVIAAKEVEIGGDGDDPEYDIKTFFGVVGYPELLAAALYSELATLAETGDYGLFFALRDALLNFAEDYGVSDDMDVDESTDGKTLH